MGALKEKRMPDSLDVIAIAPHPDDAEATCGGLLAKLSRRGYRVAICDLTRGELGSNGTPEERAAEAQQASQQLGLHVRLNLGLPDGGIDGRESRQIEVLVRLLRRHAPRLLIGPHERSRHPDHAEASELVRRAHFYSGVRRFAPEIPAVDRPVLLRALDYHPMPHPSFVVDISDFLAAKLAALRCYRSQFERRSDRVATLINDPSYLRRIEINAGAYGQLIGCDAGEPFAVQGGVPVEDPVQLFAPGERRA
jgi:bacillithiol biosynthesis deacetylase BshB1